MIDRTDREFLSKLPENSPKSFARHIKRSKCKNSDTKPWRGDNQAENYFYFAPFSNSPSERLSLISFDLVFSSPYREFISPQGDLFTDHVSIVRRSCHGVVFVVVVGVGFSRSPSPTSKAISGSWFSHANVGMCRKQLFTGKIFCSRANAASACHT